MEQGSKAKKRKEARHQVDAFKKIVKKMVEDTSEEGEGKWEGESGTSTEIGRPSP